MAVSGRHALNDAWVERVFEGEDLASVCAVGELVYFWVAEQQKLLPEIFERDPESDAVVRYLRKRGRVFSSLDEAKAYFLQRNVGQK